ncbi:MAG: hypothetical protein NWE86_03045 [Candidatus Bathyarchaeota archaeon]|nr:hypothetical protein [Candidatus Bathyarchaeota archaeon]
MPPIKKSIIYFNQPGFINTNSVIEAIKERLKEEDIESILVPLTTGKTATTFSKKIGTLAKIVAVSEVEAASACRRIASADQGLFGKLIRKRLEAVSEDTKKVLHREAFDLAFLPFCGESWNVVKEILYAFGQGMKVAIELPLAAVEINKVGPYKKVISVGGTGEGVDTAIVVRTAPQNKAFGKNPDTRLIIQEIIAMPIEKW